MYRGRFDELGLTRAGLESKDPLEVLRRMPALSGERFYQLVDESIALAGEVIDMETSSGTTGRRKRRIITHRDDALETELLVRLFGVCGIGPSDSVACVDIGPLTLMVSFTRALDEMGAGEVINSLDGPFNEEALRLTGGRGVDVVVELVGRPETMTASVHSLDKGGRLVFVGFYDVRASIDFQPSYIMQREITFMGSRYCSRQELAESVEMVARGQIRPVVTRKCRLEEADEVLRSIERMEIAGRACVEIF